ncbi:MAG: M14 family metallopeptidase [Pseudomonadota bacterium]|nr:M14 family metallopeptidase [Pseudomonadota bacterium]
MNLLSFFSPTYSEARSRFLEEARRCDLDVTSHIHPLLGSAGEELALDVGLDGARRASCLLILSSGCHGIEGHVGSAVQVALLNDPGWRQSTREAGIAVLYLHALNPHGFSWGRRTTQENVDLNRNFHDFTLPLPRNPGYDEMAGLLVPHGWPPSEAVQAALGQLLAERGLAAMQQAISCGQHDHPEGLFYGGHNPTWSHVTLRHVLREHGRDCSRLGWIDLHSGLGRSGVGERIFEGRAGDEGPGLHRARSWWGGEVTSIDDGESASAAVTGQMLRSLYAECPQAECTGITLEFGTVPLMQVITALRAEQWLENHPETPPPTALQIKQQLRAAFYPDSDEWKRQVLEQAVEAARQAVVGLRTGSFG